MSNLAKKSNANRIKRHITCEIFVDPKHAGRIPSRTRKTDAGFDLAVVENTIIKVGETKTLYTGICVKCPEGYFYKLEHRSSTNKRELIMCGAVIDATYSGPLYIKLHNRGNKVQHIEAGDRLAQLVFYPQIHVNFLVVDKFKVTKGDRGENGFGSTGK